MIINVYGTMLISSLVLGVLVACLLGTVCGIRKRTIFYTVLFTVMSIFMFSFLCVFILGKGKTFGFSGLGGAFGLMIGIIFSVYVHNDHPKELFASWVVTAPLMYAVSKIGCLNAGCCSGHIGSVPIQIVVSVTFFVIHIISLAFFLKTQDKMKAAYLAMIISFIARIILDIFHDSHVGKVITNEQIMTIAAGTLAFAVFLFRKRLPRTDILVPDSDR